MHCYRLNKFIPIFLTFGTIQKQCVIRAPCQVSDVYDLSAALPKRGKSLTGSWRPGGISYTTFDWLGIWLYETISENMSLMAVRFQLQVWYGIKNKTVFLWQSAEDEGILESKTILILIYWLIDTHVLQRFLNYGYQTLKYVIETGYLTVYQYTVSS